MRCRRILLPRLRKRHAAITKHTLLSFNLPAVTHEKLTAGLEGAPISWNGGVVLLREAERRVGLAETLAGCIWDWRDPSLMVRTLPAKLRFLWSIIPPPLTERISEEILYRVEI